METGEKNFPASVETSTPRWTGRTNDEGSKFVSFLHHDLGGELVIDIQNQPKLLKRLSEWSPEKPDQSASLVLEKERGGSSATITVSKGERGVIVSVKNQDEVSVGWLVAGTGEIYPLKEEDRNSEISLGDVLKSIFLVDSWNESQVKSEETVDPESSKPYPEEDTLEVSPRRQILADSESPVITEEDAGEDDAVTTGDKPIIESRANLYSGLTKDELLSILRAPDVKDGLKREDISKSLGMPTAEEQQRYDEKHQKLARAYEATKSMGVKRVEPSQLDRPESEVEGTSEDVAPSTETPNSVVSDNQKEIA